ncbi:aminotransferase class V-fold PLP-dependent enzyme [Streptomyces sp. RY43-2]|uniref:Aminotransferase class V-fold PLP-dependent enzyme n=1 Tax=Streptomyces macrolidinus TaxID=2952607 RepID=A0ABT0ZM12_9ACTN|nr:aminotransferase class V-fold PLP-dependent enzyme [Streptomyces macrolidinus]MCN9244625.1 aminotransferase class V-fold PLP-dependent enzyme [Streptomyces macrolidinus]
MAAATPAGPSWADGASDHQVREEIRQLCADDHDYADGTVFNSICSEPFPLAREVFAEHFGANMGDHRIFPSLPRVTTLVTRMLGDLLGAPDAGGVPTSGATEANLLAVLAAVRDARGTGRPRVLLARNAHFSFEKILALLPVEPVWVDLDARFRADTAVFRAALATRPALAVLTSGTSECGAVDDIETLAPYAASVGVPLHVDGASGGFLVPFAREFGHPVSGTGFEIEGVESVSVDPHKYGGAPIPSGYLLVRDPARLEALRSPSHYRGAADHFGLLGTRPGAALLATYAVLRQQGRAGYRAAAREIFRLRSVTLDLLERAGLPVAFAPDLMVVGVSCPDPAAVQREMERRGLIVSVSRRFGFVRLVIQLHQTDAQLASLVDHLAEAVKETSA